jgi:hypothetical protein
MPIRRTVGCEIAFEMFARSILTAVLGRRRHALVGDCSKLQQPYWRLTKRAKQVLLMIGYAPVDEQFGTDGARAIRAASGDGRLALSRLAE